jgi:hypothetical protein
MKNTSHAVERTANILPHSWLWLLSRDVTGVE